jgi:hypothetical protein
MGEDRGCGRHRVPDRAAGGQVPVRHLGDTAENERVIGQGGRPATAQPTEEDLNLDRARVRLRRRGADGWTRSDRRRRIVASRAAEARNRGGSKTDRGRPSRRPAPDTPRHKAPRLCALSGCRRGRWREGSFHEH